MQLKENPFYILGASIYDDKNKIQQAAENKTFSDEDNGEIYARAATILTNPKKRIAAEMRWFIGCPAAQEEEIVERLDNESYYAKRFSCTLAELNFNVYALEYEILTAESIMLIGALYDLQDAEEILFCINEERKQSNFPPIRDTAEIKSELQKIREEIRRTFQFKIKEIDNDDFVELSDELANFVAVSKKSNVIVEDFKCIMLN